MTDRLIRDEILDSDRYYDLSSDSARLCFIHMCLVADDFGNLEASNAFVSRRLLLGGASGEAAAKIIAELADADLIRLYEIEGKRYAHIPRFRQRMRYPNSKIPLPPESLLDEETASKYAEFRAKSQTQVSPKSDLSQSQVSPKSAEEKRREEKRGEEAAQVGDETKRHGDVSETVDEPQRKRASRLPAAWEPSPADADFLKTRRPDLDLELTALRFCNHWHAKSGKDSTKLDWSRTWQNWVLSERAQKPPATAKPIDSVKWR